VSLKGKIVPLVNYVPQLFLNLPRHNSPQWAKASSLSRIHDHTQIDTSHSVGFFWTSDQPDAETTDNTQHSQQTDIHASGGIRIHNLKRRTAADP